MASLHEIRRVLVEASRRHSRVGHEAEDLAHDVILSALRRGLPLDDAFVRCAHRAARQHGAFLARSSGRRRAREVRATEPLQPIEPWENVGGDGVPDERRGCPPSTLSPVLQTTLFLLVSGLDKAELRAALGLSDAALRKRFQALRAHGPLARPILPVPVEREDLPRLRRSQVTLLPRLAGRLASDQRARRVLAAADPDGHGLIFAELLTKSVGTATTSAPVPARGPRKKGPPCSRAS